MIIQRLSKGIKDQDWFVVMVEVMIVVVGIFIGLQADDWNEARKDKDRAQNYLMRINDDLNRDLENLEFTRSMWKVVLTLSKHATSYGEQGNLKNNSAWETLHAYFQASQVYPYAPTSITYNELENSGEIRLIENHKIRATLADYYTVLSGIQEKDLIDPRPQYRPTIRGLMPSIIRSHIWNKCFSPYDLDIIAGLNCTSPINEEDALTLLQELKENKQVLNELRTWGSILEMGLTFYQDRIESVNDVIAILHTEMSK